jgi:hypothetical protein
MTLAAVDRLIHHATILEMNVESYRRKEALDRNEAAAGHPLTQRQRNSNPPLIDALGASCLSLRVNQALPSPPLATIMPTPGCFFSS